MSAILNSLGTTEQKDTATTRGKESQAAQDVYINDVGRAVLLASSVT